jgi:NAD(P)-dependent dehydrogenase (short-subunit alcohol dehydrogenase family)
LNDQSPFRFGDYKQILILGASSGIASFVLPEFDYEDIATVITYRTNSLPNLPHRIQNLEYLEEEFSEYSPQLIERLLVKFDTGHPILVISFIGVFGTVASYEEFEIEDVISTASKNLRFQLILQKLSLHLPSGSLVISFSGAGIGGRTHEDASLGYLAGKAAISILNELADTKSKIRNVRTALIAPGPFPTRMQSAVFNAKSGAISEERRMRARDDSDTSGRVQKVCKMIEWLSMNQDLAGGRIWSAQHDELSIPSENEFGKIRRIY